MAVRSILGLLLRRRGVGQAAPGSGAGEDGTRCRYVAVIMDGNGRWAQRRHLPVAAGHRAGVKALRTIIQRSLDMQVEALSVFSFSTENWRRPADEVAALMDLFVEMIEREVPDLHAEHVRMRFLGRREGVPAKLVERIEAAEALTAANTRMNFYVAFNYGGRAEMTDAARAFAAASAQSAAAPGPGVDADDENVLRPFLYAPEMHDPELLIRTSGEMRISNFLLWQLAYTELYFSPKLWPDFDGDDLDEALAEFARRRRRYGGR